MYSDRDFEYTLNMEQLFKGRVWNLKSYYCREDFVKALQKVDYAKADSKLFRMNDLHTLCKARGIEIQELVKDRTLLNSIPTRVQMKEALLHSFYDIYKEAYSSADVMERIVRRLAPEYQDDTVRTAILKKFLCGAGEGFKRFHTSAIRDLETIDDTIFEQDVMELTAVDTLVFIQNCMLKYQKDEQIEFDQFVLGESVKMELEEVLKKYHLYEEGLSITEQLNTLSSAFVGGDEKLCCDLIVSDLIKSLETDFRKQLKDIKRVSKTGKVTTQLEVYKQAKKDAIKARKAALKRGGVDHELLGMCSDLAAGNFRVNGKTKIYLYYFAFMFEMTISINESTYDGDRDVAKNLFQDFYNDNLLRFLSHDYTDAKVLSTLEKEPTGEGINYKNFVEAIYIYFLCRRDLDLTPGERIDRSEACIKECVKRAKERTDREKTKIEKYTSVYRNNHMNVLLSKSIDEMVDYVVNHYTIIDTEKVGLSRIMISSEENTASDLMDEIMEELDEDLLEVHLFDKADIALQSNLLLEWNLKSALEERFAEDVDFMKIVIVLEARVHTKNERLHKFQRKRILMALHVLAQQEDGSLSKYMLGKRMGEKGIQTVDEQVTSAIHILRNIGYDVKQGDEKKTSYCLKNRVYEEVLLNELLQKVSVPCYDIDDYTDCILRQLLADKCNISKRITRTELIVLHFNYYISLLDDSVGIDTFPEVFEDYAFTINRFLEEARYQPLSEKNIFDMYMVVILYFYLIDSNE